VVGVVPAVDVRNAEHWFLFSKFRPFASRP